MDALLQLSKGVFQGHQLVHGLAQEFLHHRTQGDGSI
jgi:hypothetical protein